MVKRWVVGLVSLCIATSSFCEDWMLLAESDGFRWDGRSGSAENSANRAGKPIIVALGRVFNKGTKSYTFEKWYVTLDDCSRGMGKVVTLNTDNDFKYETDFVANGGTIATALADMLCAVAAMKRKQNDEKGI